MKTKRINGGISWGIMEEIGSGGHSFSGKKLVSVSRSSLN